VIVLLLCLSFTVNEINAAPLFLGASEETGNIQSSIPFAMPHETQYGQLALSDSCNNISPASVMASGSIRRNVPSKMIDGDLSTKWSNIGSDSWVMLDLGSKKAICSLDIAWDYRNVLEYTFSISVSNDGFNFSPSVYTAKSNIKSQGFENYILPSGIEGKFIRISITGSNSIGYAGIAEVRVSGSPSAEPQPMPDVYDDFEGGSTYTLTDGQISPNGKWKSLFAGFGTTKVTQNQVGNKYLYLEPMTSTSPGETHGSAVATSTSYKNFDLTVDVITIRQLRQNSPPNNWETAWVNWNAIDQFHSYGFTLKIQGFQLEKKDNNNQDDSAEIYLVTQNSPSVKLNTWQKWHIIVTGTETGTPRIQVWIDGTKFVDYLDNQPGIPRNSEVMKQGGPIVLYTEDAAVGFDNVKIKTL
jgi:F5/8 type C domain/Domain of Unknown Function (DUF1080)